MRHFRIFICLLPCAAFLAGCGESSTPQASPEATKAFAGGPMPPEARKEFEASQRASAAKIEKAKADAMAGKR